MKRIVLLGAYVVLICSYGCRNDYKRSNSENSNDNIHTEVTKNPTKDSSIDQTAIGNIHMNTDILEFESEKEEFLCAHPELGGLKIESIEGFYYDERLAAIEIFSEQQDFHTRDINGNSFYGEGWLNMYVSKYYNPQEMYHNPQESEKRIYGGTMSEFKNGQFLIIVSDLCESPYGHKSFEEIIESPMRRCYGHDLRPMKMDNSSNILRMISVIDVINELPKERADYLRNQFESEVNRVRSGMNDDPGNNMAIISAESRIAKNYFSLASSEVQAQRERLLKKHKDDPSWSYILILYRPLLEKYRKDIKAIEDKNMREKEKELDVI